MAEERLAELERRLAEISHLRGAMAVLHWDQNTYMPPGGTDGRARQLATLGRIAHEKLIDPELGGLLEALRPYEESRDYASDEASLIRVARRDYERASKVPPEFTAELYRHGVQTFEVWSRARPNNDFASVRPCLEETLDLSRRLADFFPGYEHVADPLIDDSDYGVKASELVSLFGRLREALVPLARAITSQPPIDDACLHQHYPEAKQLAFANEVVRRFGYDFQRGRQDKSPHPFSIRLSINDVRITTRVRQDDLGQALFSLMHEAGHGMHSQGHRQELEGTALAGSPSSGVAESQSRLWENLVGRSRGFWEFFYPRLQQVFPEQLGSVDLDTFYRAINKVAPSVIRTDSDEVHYNLHVMMRFDFELQMLEGRLAVRDLPEAWRERSRLDLGLTPPDDRDGVLQDVHWYDGVIGGMFQGYTLGNVLSAQLFEAALAAHPGTDDDIAAGRFETLHGWLRENIWQHGRKFTPAELVERATGRPLPIEPYIRYLHQKYGQLYALEQALP